MRRLVAGLFFALLSLSLTFAFFELALLFFNYTPRELNWQWATTGLYTPDKELIYRLLPDIRDSDGNIYTNELGVKAAPYRQNYERCEHLVVVLGDSFVWGNTSFLETYPALLEKILNSKGGGACVLNAGISGYGTEQEYQFFRLHLLPRIKTSVLVWNVSVNDIYDNCDRPLFDFRKGEQIRLPAWMNGLYLQGVLLRNMPTFLLSHSRVVNFVLAKLENIQYFGPRGDSGQMEWSLSKMSFEFDEMKKLAKTNDFILIFAISPSQMVVENLPGSAKEEEYINKIKKAIGYDATIIDQNEYLVSRSFGESKNEFFPDDRSSVLGTRTQIANFFLNESERFTKGSWHPNELGNYFMAESIAETLLNRGLIQPR